jgi:RNA polymerase sigma-70 factor (ECF subfamily)
MGRAIQKYLKSANHILLADAFEKYHVRMVSVAAFYLKSHQHAEDVVAEVFTQMLEKKVVLEKINNPKSYLYTAVKRRCLDELNKASFKNRQDLESVINHKVFINFKDPEAAYLNQELMEKLQDSIKNLPLKPRTVFLMVKEDNLKYKEVAEILNISEKTVEMHMGIALKALRNDLKHFKIPVSKNKSFPLQQLFLILLQIV